MNTIAYLKGTISFLEKYGKTRKEKADAEILKQCLEERQALEIIVKKKIDMQTMRYTVVAIMFKTNEERLEEYNLCVDSSLVLTQEEYDLVSKVVKELDKEDDTNG